MEPAVDIDAQDGTLTLACTEYVVVIQASLAELTGLRAVGDARWNERGSLALGTCLGMNVYWCAGPDPDTVSMLVGLDDETWSLALTVSMNVIAEIVRVAALGFTRQPPQTDSGSPVGESRSQSGTTEPAPDRIWNSGPKTSPRGGFRFYAGIFLAEFIVSTAAVGFGFTVGGKAGHTSVWWYVLAAAIGAGTTGVTASTVAFIQWSFNRVR